MKIKLVVPDDPVLQGRPQAKIIKAKNGRNFISVYNLKRPKDYKKYVRTNVAAKYQQESLNVPLQVDVVIYRLIQQGPKKIKKVKNAGRNLPIMKPDTDNYYKAVTDTLTGVLWQDGILVCKHSCAKFYSFRPRAEMTVTTLEDPQTNLF